MRVKVKCLKEVGHLSKTLGDTQEYNTVIFNQSYEKTANNL